MNHMAFTVTISAHLYTHGRFWTSVRQCSPHHQNSKWGNIFWLTVENQCQEKLKRVLAAHGGSTPYFMTLYVGFSFNLSPICVYGIQTIGMCSHIYQITFFFFITSSSVCCGQLCFLDHIMTTARSCHILHRTRTIRPILNTYSTKLQAPVFFGNFLLPDNQHLPPNPSRAFKILFVFSLQKFSHITLLRSLHRLPISTRIQLETPFLAHTAANAPPAPITFMPLSSCVSPREGLLPVQLQKLLHPCF